MIMAAEELPAGSRAYGVSLLALCAGLGSGMVVWALPLADLGTRGWRALYLLPLAGMPLAWMVAHRLPETARFVALSSTENVATPGGPPPRPKSLVSRHRLMLLCVTTFLVLLFRAPASQLQNEFLRDERGFSASRISLFTVVTSTPAGLGVLIGGRLADVRGRRVVAAIGLVVGALGTTFAFLTHGWSLWAWQLLGIIVGAFTVPALGTYGAELFGTSSRGRANGYVAIVGLAGSAIGLIAAGAIGDRYGLGQALLILSAGPLAVAAIVFFRFPETANVELEALNAEPMVETAGVQDLTR